MIDPTAMTDAELETTVQAIHREMHEAVCHVVTAHKARLAPYTAEWDRRTREKIDLCRETSPTSLQVAGIKSTAKVSDIGAPKTGSGRL